MSSNFISFDKQIKPITPIPNAEGEECVVISSGRRNKINFSLIIFITPSTLKCLDAKLNEFMWPYTILCYTNDNTIAFCHCKKEKSHYIFCSPPSSSSSYIRLDSNYYFTLFFCCCNKHTAFFYGCLQHSRYIPGSFDIM